MTEAEAAQECAAIYTAIAARKKVMVTPKGGTARPYTNINGPTVDLILSGVRYTIVEEPPETIWAIRRAQDSTQFYFTEIRAVADAWRNDGLTVYVYDLAGTSFRTGIAPPSSIGEIYAHMHSGIQSTPSGQP